MHADLVLLNANIYTFNPVRPHASALAAREGKIVYVGDDATARDLLEPGGEALDLKGCCALPGLTDAHVHFHWFSVGLQQVNAETPTLQEAVDRVAERVARAPRGAWILGYGWNHNNWGGNFPTAAQLDRVAPHNPVYLGAKSGHAGWANTCAFERAGISAHTPDPIGGEIVRDASGAPAGVLLEDAENLMKRIVPEPSPEELAAAMRVALPVVHRLGITGVHDFDRALSFRAHQILRGRGEMGIRVLKSIPLDLLDHALGLGLRSGFGDDWLRIGHVKMFTDGALGPRTAWMLQGFDSAPDNRGIATIDPGVLRDSISRANDGGLACAVHAIGDRAVRETLNAYEACQVDPHRLSARNRIEHVQLISPEDEGRLAKLGIVASMQPLHATSDMLMAERHWGKRCAQAYAIRTQLSHGAVVALGSDCPVEVMDPLAGIHAAVTRRRADGSPGPEGWYPEQRLTVEEAVRGFTFGPAYVGGMETKLGSLVAGKLADVTVLEQDIFKIDPMEILHAGVAATVVGGRVMWRSPQL